MKRHSLQYKYSKNGIKKYSDLSKFHKFIQKNVDSGLISHQEGNKYDTTNVTKYKKRRKYC